MKRFSNKEIPAEIKTGNEEVLNYISREYFPASRRLMRLRGVSDSETPRIFSTVLASLVMGFQKRRTVSDIDFETTFFKTLDEFIKEYKNNSPNPDSNISIASQCVSILDDQLQKILFARIVEKMSYENIAERFQYSNPVIAQHEVHKALNQLEGIVKLRMNISPN